MGVYCLVATALVSMTTVASCVSVLFGIVLSVRVLIVGKCLIQCFHLSAIIAWSTEVVEIHCSVDNWTVS